MPGKAALLAGGVPCPPFSVAGKQLGSADERDLFAWAVEAASRMQPEAVLLENVRGLNDARFAGYRQAVVDRFADLGYTAFWELLEARDFGVPQLRPRMILVALRPEYVEYFAWPEKSAVTRTVSGVLSNLMAANHWREDYLEKWIKAADRIAPTIVGGSKKHGGADLGPTRAKRAWAELWTDGHGLANSAPRRGLEDRGSSPRPQAHCRDGRSHSGMAGRRVPVGFHWQEDQPVPADRKRVPAASSTRSRFVYR
nr:hypothetical protein GCM10020092_101330 [Actinoplanes digitatis]